MDRRALIIAAPDAIPGKPLNGTVLDLVRWQNYLLSPRGGAWHPHREVSLLFDPTKEVLLRHLAWVEDTEFACVVFSGHGYTDFDRKPLNSLRLAVGPGAEVGLERLMPLRAPWSMTIVDACRNIVRRPPQYGAEVGDLGGLVQHPAYDSADRHRKLFDHAVRATDPHHEVVMSTSLGASAAEIRGVGGLFTSELLGSASDWMPSRPAPNGAYRTLRNLVKEVRPLVLDESNDRQRPRWASSDPDAGSLPFSVAVPLHRRLALPRNRAGW